MTVQLAHFSDCHSHFDGAPMRFSPDRSVHLRQQRRRYETEPNTPFVNRRRETAEVGRDAAAHAHKKTPGNCRNAVHLREFEFQST
jgi:hypothetical protein